MGYSFTSRYICPKCLKEDSVEFFFPKPIAICPNCGTMFKRSEDVLRKSWQTSSAYLLTIILWFFFCIIHNPKDFGMIFLILIVSFFVSVVIGLPIGWVIARHQAKRFNLPPNAKSLF
jgi:hypothetical protein